MNNLQMAITQIILHLSYKYPQQVHVLPGGHGKSRVAGQTASMALLSGRFSKVHLVFTTERLRAKDEAELAELFELTGLAAQVDYHLDLDFAAKKDELVIMDEGDE